MKLNFGFTIVELIVVLLLIGILAAISFSRLIDRSGVSEPVVVDQVAQALRYARDHAVASGCPVQAILTTTQVSLRRPDTLCAANFNATVPAGDGSGPYVVQTQDGHAISARTLVFQPTGALQAVSDETITVGGFSIRVHAATGYVEEL